MKILLAERIILNVLSFDLIVEQPYNTMMTIAQELHSGLSFLLSRVVGEKQLQAAWRFTNDSWDRGFIITRSVLTTVAIKYTEGTIAAACIYLSITGYNVMPIEQAMPVLLSASGADETQLMSCVQTLKALYHDFDQLFQWVVCCYVVFLRVIVVGCRFSKRQLFERTTVETPLIPTKTPITRTIPHKCYNLRRILHQVALQVHQHNLHQLKHQLSARHRNDRDLLHHLAVPQNPLLALQHAAHHPPLVATNLHRHALRRRRLVLDRDHHTLRHSLRHRRGVVEGDHDGRRHHAHGRQRNGECVRLSVEPIK